MKDTLPARVLFGAFELDLKAGEVRLAAAAEGESRTVLPNQPFRLLVMLVEREGEIVTRDEIKKSCWPNDTIVEFDHSINVAIGKLRKALGDSADEPKYIETVGRRGYRLMVPVERVDSAEDSSTQQAFDSGARSDSDVGAAPKTKLKAGRLTGKVVSHYRVVEIIGGGGMGLVYRAEDLKLGRAVALKFLPEEVGDDPKALQRFEREARAASALDDPHICTIHEFGEHEGQPFIVMELLEGETLRDRLASVTFGAKPISLNELLEIAIQTTNGLQAAHEKGIIHRDIKPANIFLTNSGQAKILDFGVAKLTTATAESATAESREGGSHDDPKQSLPAPASDPSATRTGVAMGTEGYMSPEQVRGEKLDARADLFSFGLVLYEMATGQRAFSGNTAAMVRDAIVNKTPIPLRKLNSALPAKLVSIIDRALEKDREQRWQSAAEVRVALQEVRRVAAPLLVPSRRLKRFVVACLAIVVVAACATGIWWWRRPLARVAFQKYRITALTSTGNVAFADISPDGRYLAYADEEIGRQSIWVRQLAASTTVRVLGPVPFSLGRGLRFTPDGNYLYYSEENPDGLSQSLYRLAVLGGTPEKIMPNVWTKDYGWYSSAVGLSPDGRQIVFDRRTDKANYLFTANADGSGERLLLTLPASEQMRVFAWAPDGQTIAFGIDEAPGAGSINCVAVISSQGGKERRILRHVAEIHGMAWLPDQSGLVITGVPSETERSALWIVSYPEGTLHRLTNDVAVYLGVSLAHDGRRLVTIQRQIDSSLWVAPALNPSQATQVREGAGEQDGYGGVAWLPDGRLVYTTGESELWLVDRDGNQRRRLTYTHHRAGRPSASAGTTVVFTSETPSSAGGSRFCDIWAIDVDGSNLRQITHGPGNRGTPEISPDGRWITYDTVEGPWKMALSGGEATLLDPNGDYPTISPDGRWIAFGTYDNNTKQSRIRIIASDGKGSPRFLPFFYGPQVPMSTNFGSLPIRWTAAGDAITYVRTQNGVSNLWSQPIDGSPAKQVTNFTSMLIWWHAWSRDGKYLVMARGNFSRDAVMLTDLR